MLDLAIRRWGFEDPRTIVIALLEELGNDELATDLFEVCTDDESCID